MAAIARFYTANVTQPVADIDAGTSSTVKPAVMFSFYKAGVDSNAVPFEFVGIAEPLHIAQFPVEYQTFVDTPPAEPI
jgi:hypothetical protein